MNIVYLHTHDSGRFLPLYGYGSSMPQLGRLAERGALLRGAFCACPTCSPSRTALLTGMAPHSAGLLGLAHRGFQLADYSWHLSSFLRSHGYETALCGIQHEAPDPSMLGYDHLLGGEADSMDKLAPRDVWDRENARAAAAWLREKHDGPFFLSYGMFATHREFPENDGSVNPDRLTPPWPVADTPENRADAARYQLSCRQADNCIGILLDALEETGRMEDTVVLYTTDHGPAFPEMKCTLSDAGIGVAAVLYYPGIPCAGRAVDGLVSQIDLFPTFCELLGLEKPAWLQGKSILPLLERGEPVNDAIFAGVTYHAAYEPKRCVRTERYKLVRRYDSHLFPVPANIDSSPAKELLLKSGYLERTVLDRESLFDLYLDPCERQNRIADPAYAEIYADLSRRLNRWMEETADPLRDAPDGRVPCPEGARVNRRECIEPQWDDFE